jgi:predicted MFS family arabinose efflux permease
MTTVTSPRGRTFSALGRRDFRVFCVGHVVSTLGTSIASFALGWLVVQLAERDGVPGRAGLYLGVVGLAHAVPSIVMSLVGGAMVDRADRRFLLFVANTSALVVAAVLAALTLTGAITLGWVVVLSIVGAVTSSFEPVTRQAILPQLIDPGMLVSAVGLNSTAFSLAWLVGPLLGGVLLGPIGIGGLMVFSAVSYLAALGSLALLPALPSVTTGPRPRMLASIGEGLAYLRGSPFLRSQLLFAAVWLVLAGPLPPLLPAFVDEALGLGGLELSWLGVAGGVGGLAATLVAASLASVRRPGLVLIAGALGAGLSLALFAVQSDLGPALLLMVAVGFTTDLVLTVGTTVIQLVTPDHLRGRAIGVEAFMVQTCVPAGALLFGSLGTLVGIDVALTIGGATLALASVAFLVWVPSLRGTPAGTASLPGQGGASAGG